MQFLLALVVGILGYVLGTRLTQDSGTVMAMVVGGVAAALALSRPAAMLVVVLAMAPLHGMARAYYLGPMTALWKELLTGAIALGWVGRLVIKRQRLFRTPLNAPVLLFSLLAVVHTFLAPTLIQGLYELKKMIPFVPLFFFVANSPLPRRRIKQILAILLFVGVATAFWGIVQRLLGPEFLLRHGLMYPGRTVAFPGARFMRVWSTYGGPGFFAANVVAFMMIALALYLHPRAGFRRGRLLIGLAILFVALVFTMSRGPVLLATAGFVFLSTLTGQRSPVVLLILAVGAVVLIFPAVVVERAAMTFGGEDSSFHFRLWFLLNAGIPDMLAHPFGTGLGTTRGFNTAVVEYLASGTGLSTNMSRIEGGTENGYLHVGIQMGFPGLILFCWILIALLVNAARVYRHVQDPLLKAVAAAAAGIALEVALGNMLGVAFDAFPLDLYFWTFAGLLMTLPHVEAAEQPEEPRSAPSWPYMRYGS
jgi:putative inorganic carbon (HCO3(-)) transporter